MQYSRIAVYIRNLVVVIAAIVLPAVAAFGQTQSFTSLEPSLSGGGIPVFGQLKSSEQMPGQWTVIELQGNFKPGSTLNKPIFLSRNGRYAVVGTIYDLWDKDQRSLDSIEAIRKSLSVVPIDQLAFKPEELRPLTIGTETGKDVYVFLDPLCDKCQPLVKQIEALSSKYKFQIFTVPTSGQDSGAAVVKISCTSAPSAAFEALKTRNFNLIPQVPKCDRIAINKRLVVWELMSFRQHPVVIRKDGLAAEGPDINLKTFLD